MIIKIEDRHELSQLCGPDDSHLQAIESVTGDRIFSYGDEVIIEPADEKREPVYKILIEELTKITSRKEGVSPETVSTLLKAIENGDRLKRELFKEKSIQLGGKKKIFPRTMNQAVYIDAMSSFDIIFGIGPAGTGKTYLAVAYALSQILARKKRKLLLTRPVVEAGESLGYLPGDLSQKISPYLRPIYDVMDFLIGSEKVAELEERRIIEVAPLAYMRGRSLNECIVILDEAQNTTRTQMKMFLTRLGEESQAIITGDITQIDLPKNDHSGLMHARKLLRSIDGIHFSRFHREDVVRNPLIKKIIKAYEDEGI